MQRDTVGLALRILGVLNLAQGAFMVVAPREFYDLVGPFGAYNDHYIRDVSTFYLALGAVMLAAANRPRWRAAVLAFAALQVGLHTINHIVDVGDADPVGVGVFDAVSLAALTALYLWLWRRSEQEVHA
jgi:hypothetical protein